MPEFKGEAAAAASLLIIKIIKQCYDLCPITLLDLFYFCRSVSHIKAWRIHVPGEREHLLIYAIGFATLHFKTGFPDQLYESHVHPSSQNIICNIIRHNMIITLMMGVYSDAGHHIIMSVATMVAWRM